jgi:hypothetical protein
MGEEPKSRTPDWVFSLVILGAAFVVFAVLVFVYDNAVLALRDTGRLLKYVGITIFVWAILSALVAWIRGKRNTDKSDEKKHDPDED